MSTGGASALRRAESSYPVTEAERLDIISGLQQTPKRLPAKLFYDGYGSQLFERICRLREYYLTRTELDILRAHKCAIAAAIGKDRVLVEYGSGSSTKTRILLDTLESVAAYVPIDICGPALDSSRVALSKAYPNLTILPVCADYTTDFELPAAARSRVLAAFFPGSTIGNFDPAPAVEFLRRVATCCGRQGSLLVGVDLRKEPTTLLAAYNDSEGVTAEFNLNVLRVLNREFHGTFELAHFRHDAIWNDTASRIEMHLVSQRRQVAMVGAAPVFLDAGERIVTEYCYKYELPEFRNIAEQGGFRVDSVWLDEHQLFSVQLLRTLG